jgi:hypothetical protein
MPTARQDDWLERALGVKTRLAARVAAEPVDEDDAVDSTAHAVAMGAATYADFSVGEVQGAAKVIVPLAQQASAVGQNLNPAVAAANLGDAAYKLASDEQYRDAAIAKAEAVGNTVLGVAQVAAQVSQVTTDLLVNPLQGAQEVASAASAGAQKLGQVYDRVSTGYQQAAAQGDGAQYVGNLVGQAGAMVGMAVAGAPEAASEGLAAEGLGAAESEGLAAGGDATALATEGGAADGAVRDAGAGGAERESRGSALASDHEPTVPDGAALDDGGQSGDAVVDGSADATIPDGGAVETELLASDAASPDAEAGSGEAGASDDASLQTQEGAPADDATPLLGGPPVDIEALVDGAADQVQAMADDDLAALSSDQKNKLVEDLTMGGRPSGEAQEALRKVYRSMAMDPAFRAEENARIGDIARSLAGDEDLQAAQANWKSLKPQEKVGALQKVLDAQSQAYGIDPPEVEMFDEEKTPDGLIKSGSYKDGKIRVNTNADSAFNDFDSAVDLIAHENAHAYQDALVERLNSGELQPGDPEYAQAKTFASNKRDGAYIRMDSPADEQDYRMQPMEDHAFDTGQRLSKSILKVL